MTAESAGIGTWVADAVLCMGRVVAWAVGAASGFGDIKQNSPEDIASELRTFGGRWKI